MWERTQHTHTYLRKQTRAHTYAQKLTYTRNEEIKVWPLSAALISSCRLYLLNLLFLALIPSLHGGQPPLLASSTVATFNCPLFCFSYAHALCFFFLARSTRPRYRPLCSSNRIGNWIQRPSDRGSIRVYFSVPLHRLEPRASLDRGVSEPRRKGRVRLSG